jgi:hypothetical protein
VRRVVRHHDYRNRDKENPERKEEGSALTVVGFQGFKRPTLDHWIHEVVKSDLPSVKRVSRESLLWVQISRWGNRRAFRVL